MVPSSGSASAYLDLVINCEAVKARESKATRLGTLNV